MEPDTATTIEETATAVETTPEPETPEATPEVLDTPTEESAPAEQLPEISAPEETEAPEPKTGKDHTLQHAFARARALDAEISMQDTAIADAQKHLKSLKEEREQLVTELRRCIRGAGQGELFPPPESAAVDPATGEILDPDDEDDAGDDAAPPAEIPEPPLKLEGLRFTQERVEKVFHEVVEIFGERKVLWALAGEPDRPEKIGMALVKKLEETLAAEKERIPDDEDDPQESEE